MESQTYKGVKLTQKGISPNSYQNALANSVSEEISARLSNDDDLLEASQIVNFKIWPSHDDRKAIQGEAHVQVTKCYMLKVAMNHSVLCFLFVLHISCQFERFN
jgi:flavin-binding protein dodecin